MPVSVHFSTPGTYTIDDDGVRGNGRSLVRDASGATLFPIMHPADSIEFIADVPGVTLVFNVADSFGTANVTVGSLTDPALRPDNIVVKSLRTDAFVTLAAQNAITEGGADPSADITAAGVIMRSINGIGTPANAIETQVTFVEADTISGGINLVNSGSVQIGGLTPEVQGLFVRDTGDINFTTTGFIVAADGTGAQSVRGGNMSGNVTLTAVGADSDIFTNIDQKMVSAAGGGITLNAGRDIALGTTGTNYDNDLLATTFVNLRAGHDVVIDGATNIRTSAFGGVVGGPIDIRAGRNIELGNATGGTETIESYLGDVLLTAGPGGAFIENATLPGAIRSSEDIVVVADTMQIASGGLNTTGVGAVTLRPLGAGRAIDIGSTLDSPGTLAISDDELDLMFTLNLNIGDATTGPAQVSAPLTPFIVDNLRVQSSGDIVVNAAISLPRSLTLLAGDDLIFTAAGSFASANGGFLGYADNAQADDNAGGTAILDGVISTSTGIQVNGSVDADTLIGSSANEIFDGRGGADLMTARGGDDWYYVDNAGDVAFEFTAEGANDRVFASVSYTLPAGSDIERLSTNDNLGTAAINLTGNNLANTVFGNAGANVLDGAGGADTMVGFGGNDWFYIDNALDTVSESAGGGTNDRVLAGVSYTLGAGVQVEMFTTNDNLATTAINLTGNELVNAIYGNAGANVLDGKAGADTLVGFQGNDWFYVDNAADAVFESAGGGTNDRVFAGVSYALGAGVQVEMLTTNDNLATTAINLTGNELANLVYGNAGANVLDGKAGADTLTGMAGSDTFRFTTALGGGNVDSISDYSVAADTIQLENAVFTGLAAGALAAGAFNTGSAASQADDRIIYNAATGALLFDVDGVGGAAGVQFATLSTGLAMAAGEFVVI